ncbi:hypothetical protein [Calothrix sp. UHCC 0171]|uniref:hypothetical protein n=1 Tax=Calothrix sp. UHCC 0171 TaxID=3110245 RepID=UPI002B20557D|nr:hypothetical protein [Calothrix sp. UHCC 0171]MEA5569903.1 hypothetical protein [Calothrix sp. UHCC 0171]
MDSFQLKIGERIGVFFYDDWRGSKAVIDEIEDISVIGTVTLKSGIRYNKLGQQVGALGEGTSLCTVEKAQEIINKSSLKTENTSENEEDKSGDNLVEKKRDRISQTNHYAAKLAAQSAIKILNQHGLFNSADANIDVLATKIEQLIISDLENLGKNNSH